MRAAALAAISPPAPALRRRSLEERQER
uniref:Uncharacterized protein n=1 Tax=Arundo donax TaxID=35708 RepID=A0A0A9CE94_ARUDO